MNVPRRRRSCYMPWTPKTTGASDLAALVPGFLRGRCTDQPWKETARAACSTFRSRRRLRRHRPPLRRGRRAFSWQTPGEALAGLAGASILTPWRVVIAALDTLIGIAPNIGRGAPRRAWALLPVAPLSTRHQYGRIAVGHPWAAQLEYLSQRSPPHTSARHQPAALRRSRPPRRVPLAAPPRHRRHRDRRAPAATHAARLES